MLEPIRFAVNSEKAAFDPSQQHVETKFDCLGMKGSRCFLCMFLFSVAILVYIKFFINNHKSIYYNENDIVDNDKCFVISAGYWGLGSNLVHLILALSYTGSNNLYWEFSNNKYGCCKKGHHCEKNGWNTIFKPIDILNLLPKHLIHYNEIDRQVTFEDSISKERKTCLHTIFNELVPPMNITHPYPDDICDKVCETLIPFWKPTDNIQNLIDHELFELSLHPKPIIAIHLRGGDKVRLESRQYKLTPAITQLRNTLKFSGSASTNASSDYDSMNTFGTCVILGDDSTLASRAIGILKDILPCYIVNRVRPNYSHDQDTFNNMTNDFRCHETKNLLIDVEILSNADAAIGLADSNVVRLAANLRRCQKNNNLFFDWHGRNVYDHACNPFLSTLWNPFSPTIVNSSNIY